MILPFGLSTLKETIAKKKEEESKMAHLFLQTSTEVTTLKTQADKTVQLLEELKIGPVSSTQCKVDEIEAKLYETMERLENMERNLIDKLSENLLEQQQNINYNKEDHNTLGEEIRLLRTKLKKNHRLTGFLFFFNILSLAGIAFLILYLLEIIVL